MIGSSDKHCVLTLVDRKTGYTMIGKLESRTVKAVNRRAIGLLRGSRRRVRTVTVDNGTEFHGHKKIEATTGTRFFFAAPYHSWERGTSENTNGLIRQYLPKRTSMAPMHLAGSRELLFMICETCNKATATAADRWMENHLRERARPLPRSF